MESSSGANNPPSSRPISEPASINPDEQPEAAAFGRSSKTSSTNKQLATTQVSGASNLPLPARSTTPSKTYPDFSALDDEKLISFYIAQYPNFRPADVEQQKVLISDKGEHAQTVLKQAKKEPSPQKKQIQLDFFCEYKLVCMNESIHLYRVTGNKAALTAAQNHCHEALRQSPDFTRGLMLFYLAESMIYRSDAVVSEKSAADQYMQQAADYGIAPACWRLACNRLGYGVGAQQPEDLPEGLEYIQQMVKLRQSTFSHQMQDQHIRSYYQGVHLHVQDVMLGLSDWHDDLQTLDIIRLMNLRKSTYLSRDDQRKFFNHTRGYREPCAASLTQGLVIFERGNYKAWNGYSSPDTQTRVISQPIKVCLNVRKENQILYR